MPSSGRSPARSAAWRSTSRPSARSSAREDQRHGRLQHDTVVAPTVVARRASPSSPRSGTASPRAREDLSDLDRHARWARRSASSAPVTPHSRSLAQVARGRRVRRPPRGRSEGQVQHGRRATPRRATAGVSRRRSCAERPLSRRGTSRSNTPRRRGPSLIARDDGDREAVPPSSLDVGHEPARAQPTHRRLPWSVRRAAVAGDHDLLDRRLALDRLEAGHVDPARPARSGCGDSAM